MSVRAEMSTRGEATFSILAVTMISLATLTATGAPATSLMDYDAAICGSEAYRSAEAPIQQSLKAVAGLATSFALFSPADVLKMPGEHKQSSTGGGYWSTYTVKSASGSQLIFRYEQGRDLPRDVLQTEPDGSWTKVSFHQDGSLEKGSLSSGGASSKESLLGFAEDNANLPRFIVLSNGLPEKIVFWDGQGTRICDLDMRLLPPQQVVPYFLSRLTPEQIAALEVATETILQMSKPFQASNAEIKAVMGKVVRTSDHFSRTPIEELLRKYDSPNTGPTVKNNIVSYWYKGYDENLWTLSYSQDTGRLRDAKSERMALHFEKAPMSILDARVRAGRTPREEETTASPAVWFISLFMEPVTPRMAVKAIQPAPNRYLADGQLEVWNPQGASLLSVDFSSPADCSEVVRRLEEELSESQKKEIGWRVGGEFTVLLSDD